MNFDQVYEYLFDGYAVVVNRSQLVYMGENDDTFFLNYGDDDLLEFSEERNPGPFELQENGFFLVSNEGEKFLIQRLKLG